MTHPRIIGHITDRSVLNRRDQRELATHSIRRVRLPTAAHGGMICEHTPNREQ